MSISIWFEGRWPDLNSYIDAERANPRQAARLKRTYTEAAQTIAQAANVGMAPIPCRVRCLWHVPNRRMDLDNLAFGLKFVLDGLVRAGVLPNDGRRQVQAIEHRVSVQRQGLVGVRVELLEEDEESQ